MKVQVHVLNALHKAELTNGEVITLGQVTHDINAVLYQEGWDDRVTYAQVEAVLKRFVKRGYYQGSIRQVNIKRYGVGYKVSW